MADLLRPRPGTGATARAIAAPIRSWVIPCYELLTTTFAGLNRPAQLLPARTYYVRLGVEYLAGTPSITSLTTWNQIIRVIIARIAIKVDGNERTLTWSRPWFPLNRSAAPVARMSSWANLLVQDYPVDGNRPGVAKQRMLHTCYAHIAVLISFHTPVYHSGPTNTRG